MGNLTRKTCLGEVALRSIFLVYVIFVFCKYYFQFDDGVTDVAVLGFAVVAVAVKPRNIPHEVSLLLKERVTLIWLIFTAYYLSLTFRSYNSLDNIFLEYFSVFKWLVYFFVGYLVAGVYRIRASVFPGIVDMVVVVTVILMFSLYYYNWSGLGGIGDLFGFYDNSFGSIFSLRSVFAIFGFIVAIYALNTVSRHGFLGFHLFLSSFVFIFMSGNRKMLLAVMLISLFMKWHGKYKYIYRGLSYMFLVFAVFIGLNLSIVERSFSEYSNPDQPRLLSYSISYQIASDYFPFGSGPATFASRGSMKNYSPIYEEYGLDDRWGFRETDDVHFYNDTYWAQIIGQYGFVGLTLVLLLLMSIWSRIGGDGNRVSNRLLLSAVVLLSITTPALQRTEIALFVFFVFGMYVRQRTEHYRGRDERQFKCP